MDAPIAGGGLVMADVTATAPIAAPSHAPSRLRSWLLAGQELRADKLCAYAQERPPEKVHSWWKVMCLTGIDYFSTLAYFLHEFSRLP